MRRDECCRLGGAGRGSVADRAADGRLALDAESDGSISSSSGYGGRST